MTRKSFKAAQQNIITQLQARSALRPATSGTSLNEDPFAGLIVSSPSLGSSSGQGSAPSNIVARSPPTPSTENVVRRSVRKRKISALTVANPTVAEEGRQRHIRGLCTMRNTADRVAKEGRIKVTWDKDMKVPRYPGKKKSSLSWDIGAIIRADVPMNKSTYSGHEQTALEIVINGLSAYYEIDPDADEIYAYIHKTAASIYRHFKSYCHKLYKEQGSVQPIPMEFDVSDKKREEWTFLCEHFETPEFKKKSENMTNARSKKKKNHKAGPVAFANSACQYADEGHHAPLMKAHAKAYPEHSVAVLEAADSELKEMEASQSTVVNQLTGVENDSPPQLRIPISRQVELMKPIAGTESGTRFWAFGDIQVREPLLRGPSKGGRKVTQSELEALKERVLVAERERDEERQKSMAMEARVLRLEALFARGA